MEEEKYCEECDIMVEVEVYNEDPLVWYCVNCAQFIYPEE